ncbi:MAG: PD-(D/E)XK nuclease family protein [Nitrosomonas sp.]|nr:PD-(D/E)XK nuclease family protein [Nitrosomonas sp.]
MHKAIEAFMNLSCKVKSGGRDIAGVKNSFRSTLGDLLVEFQTRVQQTPVVPASVIDFLSVQWPFFLKYVADHAKLVPYRTEWRIFDEDIKICGTIDMVYLAADGSLILHDWKCTREMKTSEPVANFRRFSTTPCIAHLPDLNYWHYVLQLNSYKYLLESKYGFKVSEMALVRIHESAEGYELYPVPPIPAEMLAIAQLRYNHVQINNK